MSGATNDKVFQRVVQLMTTSGKMSVKEKISAKACFFKIPWQLKLNQNKSMNTFLYKKLGFRVFNKFLNV